MQQQQRASTPDLLAGRERRPNNYDGQFEKYKSFVVLTYSAHSWHVQWVFKHALLCLFACTVYKLCCNVSVVL